MSTKRNLSEFVEIARKRGGECLSNEYQHIHSKLKWQCVEGHTWEATGASIDRGSWCPVCAGKIVDGPARISDMCEFATKRGGRLLTLEYRSAKSPVIFECVRGHRFESNWDRVSSQRSWCPTCRTPIGETVARLIIEACFLSEFPKCRPKWLVNDRGNRLELDGYNEALGLAFEYQGIQHSKEIAKHFHKTRSFQRQRLNDRLKREMCAVHGVRLLIIPECPNLSLLPSRIGSILQECGIMPQRCPETVKLDELDLGGDRELEYLEQAAAARGLELLTKIYLGSVSKHLFRCQSCKYEFRLAPKKLKSGRWCPRCSKEAAHSAMRNDIESLRELACSREGVLLSTEYRNSRTKLKWRCKKGHCWLTNADSVKQGHWCPTCAGQPKLTIEDYKVLAHARGGYCRSNEYKNAHTKLIWECSKGHVWEATPNSIRRGSWCKKCYHDRLSSNRQD
jgi:hypothetical protein